MPICPRCGAAHSVEAARCRDCGKALRVSRDVQGNQEALEFPRCVDGPAGCEGPLRDQPDGLLLCSHHDLERHRREATGCPRFTCVDGPDGCSGVIVPGGDGHPRCDQHRRRGFLGWLRARLGGSTGD